MSIGNKVGMAGTIIGCAVGGIAIAGAIGGGIAPVGFESIAPFFVLLVLGGLALTIFGVIKDANRWMATGSLARATVLETWDTGVTVNQSPLVGLLVEVQPSNGEARFQAKTRHLISRLATSQLVPGAVLNVKYDPRDHKRVKVVDAEDVQPSPMANDQRG